MVYVTTLFMPVSRDFPAFLFLFWHLPAQQKPLPAALWQQRGAFLFVFFGRLRGVPRARVGAVNKGAQALPRSAFQSNAGAGLEPAPA